MPNGDSVFEVLKGFTTPASLRDRNRTIEEALRATCNLMEAEASAITLLGKKFPVRHVWSEGKKVEVLPAPRTHTGLVRAAFQDGKPFVVANPDGDPRFTPDDYPPGLVVRNAGVVPVRQRLQNRGVLSCFNLPAEATAGEEATKTLSLLATCIGLGLENCRLARTVRKVAVTDDLTQVYNYRFLRTALRREMKRATRFRQSFTLLMVDVENLKSYNDREGHLRGSYLLRDLARILSRQVRGMDLLAKYGGDEFTVILPQTPRAGGARVAERIREAVESHCFQRCERGEMTVSIGLAMFPEDGIQPAGLIAASDAALYAAKQRGRNQVAEATGLILRKEMTA